MPHRDFLKLNTSQSPGRVYVIGDVHGEIGAFNKVLECLGPTDTLVIVGDLIDRGQNEHYHPSSAQVLTTIMDLNAAPLGEGPRVYAIKGNHEVYFLDVMRLLRKNDPSSPKDDDIETLMRFVSNGGAWAFKHPVANKNEALQNWCCHYSFGSNLVRSEPYVRQFIRSMLLSETTGDYLIEGIEKYEGYISSLPFLIKIVDGENIAWVAHSDLTLSDEALDAKIERNVGLDALEISHVTEARPGGFGPSARTSTSSLVYCGHNIIDTPSEKETNPANPVRKNTNHVNLDGGAYYTKGLLLVNHTNSTVTLVGETINPEYLGLLNYAKEEIQGHLSSLLSKKAPTIILTPSFFWMKDSASASAASTLKRDEVTHNDSEFPVKRAAISPADLSQDCRA